MSAPTYPAWKYRPYLRFVADRMWLRDWTFCTTSKPADEGNDASIFVSFVDRECTLYLAHNFDTFSPEHKRSTLIHELLHLHFQKMDSRIARAKDRVGKTWVSLFEADYQDEREIIVETLAQVISPRFPTWEAFEAERKQRRKKKKGKNRGFVST